MRDHDICSLGWSDLGIQRLDHPDGHHAAHDLRCDKARRGGWAMPAKVLLNIRPTVMAGLAKLVELVKK